MYDWELISESNLYRQIKEDWEALLIDKNKTEHNYHNFIAPISRLFFRRTLHRQNLIVSKLKLGADYEIDFLNCNDERSDGLEYQLVELESPHTPPFNKNGNPSARLNGAIQQVNNWKLWIKNNSEEAKRIFPSHLYTRMGISNFKFIILIGNIENSKPFIDRRNYLADKVGIEIRSFNWLTENLINYRFSKTSNIPQGGKGLSMTDKLNNEISNPFFISLSSSAWNDIVKSPEFELHHMVSSNVELLLEKYQVNEALFEKFKNEIKSV